MRLAVILLILVFWATPAYAGIVAVVLRPNPSPALFEALSRIHGELLSVGLEVKIIEHPSDSGIGAHDSRDWLETIASERHIDAAIEIVGDVAPTAVDIWVMEKAPRRLTVSRVVVDPNARSSSETLAIRAVEVLRSTFLERDMAIRQQPGEPQPQNKPETPTRISTPPPTPRTPATFPRSELQNSATSQVGRVGIAAGAALLASADGLPATIMPTARLDWKVNSWFEVQTALAGFGTRPTVSSANGSARVAQQLGILGGCFGLPSDAALRPFFALSAGALHTSIEGHAESPWQAHDVSRWSLLLDLGLGASARLSGRYYLTLAAHAQLAEPYTAIHIVDRVVATNGRPNLGLTLTIGAWL